MAAWIVVVMASAGGGACAPLRMTAPETGTGGAGNAAGDAGTSGEAGTSAGGRGGAATAGTMGNGGTGGGTGGRPEPPGMIAFWRFNEGAGATVLDSSGYGQPLTISSSSRWTTAGHEGAAFTFDGATDVAGVVPGVGQRLYDYPTVSLTFSAWVKPDTAAAGRPFATAVARSHEDYAFQDFWLGLVNGKPGCTIHSPSQDGPVASAVLPTTSWTHIACTYGLDGHIKLYVNGGDAAQGSSNENLGPIPTAILVGASETMQPSVVDQYFPGAIDDVRIYNRTLSDAEVLSIAR
ncbi:MAG TPA: LamG domain-containing protein [Polyangia bacterium]|nr:LamG domain-containing protein [Polyangia bacterium]